MTIPMPTPYPGNRPPSDYDRQQAAIIAQMQAGLSKARQAPPPPPSEEAPTSPMPKPITLKPNSYSAQRIQEPAGLSQPESPMASPGLFDPRMLKDVPQFQTPQKGLGMTAPQPVAPAPIKAVITKYADQYGVDPDLALRIAGVESSFNPKIENKSSSAGGLYQFINDTWKQYGKGDRFDPAANAEAGMKLIVHNQAYLAAHGIDATPAATYLAHFLGADGAVKVLSNPAELASDHLSSQAVRVNNLKGKTGADMLQWADRKLGYSDNPQ